VTSREHCQAATLQRFSHAHNVIKKQNKLVWQAFATMIQLNLVAQFETDPRSGASILKEEVYFDVLEKLPTFLSRARAAARGGRAPATPSWAVLTPSYSMHL
jgi:hypothetical protein